MTKAIVRDMNGEVMFAVESHSFLSNFVEPDEVVAMFNDVFRDLKANISPPR